MVGERRIQVHVHVRFVTKCFGFNVSMGLYFAKSGFPVVSKNCNGRFCNGTTPNRAHLFNMCGSCLGGLLVVRAPGVGGVGLILKCSAV